MTRQKVADHTFCFSNFMSSATIKKLLVWRPGLFPKGFTVEDGTYVGVGIPVTVREEVLTEFEKAGMLMKIQLQEKSMAELQDAEIYGLVFRTDEETERHTIRADFQSEM